MNAEDGGKVKHSHRMTVTAVVCEDGSTALCGIVTKMLPKGVEIVGNGTCPHPLDVRLSGPYAEAPALAQVMDKLLNSGINDIDIASVRALLARIEASS